MKYSAFTRYGFFRYSSETPEPLKFYNALGAQMDQAFDTTPGQPNSEDNEAEKFALAYHLARISVTIKKTGNQRDVSKATDLLPLREEDFFATPGPFDTLWQRQQRLLALRALPLGATQSNIASALQATLGADFLKLRTMGPTEQTWSQGPSNFTQPGRPAKLLQLVTPVVVTGSQVTVTVANLDPTIPTPIWLNQGDIIMVQGENSSLSEKIQISNPAAGTVSGQQTFTAGFANPHDVGATVFSGNYPDWQNQQSFLFVEVSAAAAADPVRRGKVDAIMAKLARGTCQWATVAPSGGNLGPFTLNVSGLGTATVGAVAA